MEKMGTRVQKADQLGFNWLYHFCSSIKKFSHFSNPQYPHTQNVGNIYFAGFLGRIDEMTYINTIPNNRPSILNSEGSGHGSDEKGNMPIHLVTGEIFITKRNNRPSILNSEGSGHRSEEKGNMPIYLVTGEVFTTKRNKIDSVIIHICCFFLMYYYQNHLIIIIQSVIHAAEEVSS